ncbi:hypothetical protein NL494_27645, partial [Klebsiella pneumoniae]|nr:hypothetical protein [Klebsiella pneumoniae]
MNSNTVVGSEAYISLSSGNYNTAIGQEAGGSSTSGNNNTLVGYRAGYHATNLLGSSNIFIGSGTAPTSNGQSDF